MFVSRDSYHIVTIRSHYTLTILLELCYRNTDDKILRRCLRTDVESDLKICLIIVDGMAISYR